MPQTQARARLVVVASPLHDPTVVARRTGLLRAALLELGVLEGADSGLPPLVLVATGGTEPQVLAEAERLRLVDARAPLALVAGPTDNALPAALESLARVRQDGGTGRVLPVDGPDDLAGLAEVDRVVSDLAVRARLRATRLGVVGEPSDWLVASTPDAATVREAWGPTLVPLPVAPVAERHAAVPLASVADLVGSFATAGTSTVTDEAVTAAARLAPPLRALVAEHDLDGLTLRCFDLLGAAGTSGCLAVAELNDAGVVAGCEGDVPTALAMLWVRAALDTVSWVANPSRVTRDGLLTVAHCTVARSLVERYDLDTHFESGIGVGLAGSLPPGPWTALRIGGRGLDRVQAFEGESVDAEHDPGLCRTQLTLQVPRSAVDRLLADPLGNHLVLLPGRHAARFVGYAELLGVAR